MIKENIYFSRKVPFYVGYEINSTYETEYQSENILKGSDPSEFRLLGYWVKQRSKKERTRDFSFLSNNHTIIYIEHLETGDIYKVDYWYRATYKSDGVEIDRVDKVTFKDFKEFNKKYKKCCLCIQETDTIQDGYILTIFVREPQETEEYNYIQYAYFIDYIEEVDEDEEEEEI